MRFVQALEKLSLSFGKVLPKNLRVALPETLLIRYRLNTYTKSWMPFQKGTPYPKDEKNLGEQDMPFWCGKDVINEPFAAINADDFYGRESFEVAAKFLTNEVSANKYSMVGYELKNTLSEFGTVSRGICQTDDQNNLVKITERHQIARNGEAITFDDEAGNKVAVADDTAVSMNFWGFHPSLFQHLEAQFKTFLDASMHLPKSEFYIPSVVFELIQQGEVKAEVLHASSPWFGVTYPEDKPYVVEQISPIDS